MKNNRKKKKYSWIEHFERELRLRGGGLQSELYNGKRGEEKWQIIESEKVGFHC